MKNLLLTIMLVVIGMNVAVAQLNDNDLERMMTKKVLTQRDVAFNIASLAPGLYKNNKIDTIKLLIDYYERNFGAGYAVLPLKQLLAIKDRTFEEAIKPASSQSYISDTAYYEREILTSLDFFKTLCANMVRPGFYQTDVREQYIPYLSFIGNLAEELKSTPGLKPAEKFLLRFYAHPMDSVLQKLGNAEYNGTRVQRAWLNYKAKQASVSGVSVGLISGVWVPTGNLSLLGPHPYLGYLLGGRGAKYAVEVNMNFRFLNSSNYYNVVAENNMYLTKYYFGGYIGVDGMYELTRKKKHAMEVLGGVAYEGMDALPGDSKDKNAVYKSIGSLNLNAGLGYRFFIRQVDKMVRYRWGSRLDTKTSYLAVQARYNVVNYKNEGGTLLNGNALTIGVIYGLYSRPAAKR